MARDFSRRDLMRLGLAAPLSCAAGRMAFAQPRPNSRIQGVQIGIISSSLSGVPADQLIPTMVRLGISEVALQPNHAEALAGAPSFGPAQPDAAAGAQALNGDGLLPRCAGLPVVTPFRTTGGEQVGRPLTPEQEERQKQLWEWRNKTTAETWAGVRRQFETAGIDLRVLWYGFGFNAPPEPTDEEIDYGFRMAKGLGVRSVSGSSQLRFLPRVAMGAKKYDLTWAGHTQDNIYSVDQFSTPEAYDKLLAVSDRMRICLDIGYFAAAGFDSVAFIRKYHRQITDIHLKDRKLSRSLGGDVTNNTVNNYPFGQGDAPIREVLQLLKREKYDIPVQIEYNYQCRTTSDSATEVARCLEYCRRALEA